MAAPKANLTFEHLREEYYGLFAGCVPDEGRLPEIDATIARIFEHRDRYEAVANKLVSVPWYFIGCLHSMECSLGFGRHLHNGDPLKARTVHVPAGRPLRWSSAGTWEESAWDALEMKGVRTWAVWDVSGMLYQAERFNGFGYRLYHPEVKSPYVWGGSNHFKGGKYVADGEWSAKAGTDQNGVGVLLRRMINTHRLSLRGQQVFAAMLLLLFVFLFSAPRTYADLGGTPVTVGGPWPAPLGAFLEPTGPQLLYVLGGLVGLMMLYTQVLTAIEKHRAVNGRKPSVDDDLRKLAEQLAGLAPSEKVDALVAQLAGAATKSEIAALQLAIAEFVKRSAMDQEIGELRDDVHNQIKEMRSYLHEGVHGLRTDLQGLSMAGEEREKRLSDKLDKHWHELNRERSVSTRGLHERIEAITTKQREELDAKVKDLREEIGDMPAKLIGILKDTGALRGGRASS